ncbi:MAG: hypothetical protein ACR2P1_18355 [Pseudomonadales bacterium]
MAKKIKIDDLKVEDELSKDDLKSVSRGAASKTSKKQGGNASMGLIGDDIGIPKK